MMLSSHTRTCVIVLFAVALLLSIIATQKAFEPVNPFAAKLLIPYLAWVTFAAALNYNLWRNNSDAPRSGGFSSSAAY